jgi:hypothetical protein
MAVPPGFERPASNCCHIIIPWDAKSRRTASPALLIFTTSMCCPAASETHRAARDMLRVAGNSDLGFQMSARWRRSAICLLLMCAAPLAVRAEEANAKPIDIAPADVAVPSAPRAAQIEPMVAPVKRSAPQTPDSKAKPAASGQRGETSQKSAKSSEAALKKSADGGAKVADQEPSPPKSLAKKLAKKNR